jgi:hypothetical protein
VKKVRPKGIEVTIFQRNDTDYISLTDIARYRDRIRTDYIIQNWMRLRDTIEFLGLWEKLNNPRFKPIDFDGFKNQAGSNSFSLTPSRWIASTNAIGLLTRSGRYHSGTFAHKDIAFEFASWISPEFKLYLIKEFERLKDEENRRIALGWDTKRLLTKINYRIHTDAIKKHLMPLKISRKEARNVYASGADILNKALFGKTAMEWEKDNSSLNGNIRDYADVTQLVCLANLESMNAEFIRQKLSREERLIRLNRIAIIQMNSLLGNTSIKGLDEPA